MEQGQITFLELIVGKQIFSTLSRKKYLKKKLIALVPFTELTGQEVDKHLYTQYCRNWQWIWACVA